MAKRVGLTDPPERLSDEDRAWLRAWCQAKMPQLVRRLEDLEERCLDHFRAKGGRMKDWRLTVKNWVRNEPNFGPQRFQNDLGAARPVLQEWKPPITEAERLEMARRRAAVKLQVVKK